MRGSVGEYNPPPTQPEVTAVAEQTISFDAYRRVHREIPDDVVVDAMNEELRSVPGEMPRFPKSYLDQIPADETDKAFLGNAESVKRAHSELADFVSEKVAIVTTPDLSPQKRAVLDGKVAAYKQKIQADKLVVDAFVDSVYRGEKPQGAPRDELAYSGLSVRTSQGKVNLLEKAVPGARSNILVQSEAAGTFVHYASKSYLEQRVNGNKPELGQRIYLNPKIEDSVAVFRTVVEAAEAADITMKAKIMDRTIETTEKRSKPSEEYAVRGDGIVLYAGEDTDRLLGMIEAIYKDHPDSFQGRKTSRVPQKIAEGVAIGDEPDLDEEGKPVSLTQSRAEAISMATGLARQRLGLSASEKITPDTAPVAVATFRQVFAEVAEREGIDPNNLAFSLPKAA